VFHISIWGGLVLCLGGLSPQKPPRGDGTDLRYQKGEFDTVLFIHTLCKNVKLLLVWLLLTYQAYV